MAGCTGCLCRSGSPDTHTGQLHPYEPLSTTSVGDVARTDELVIRSDKHRDHLVNLTLQPDSLVVVKRKPGSLHSLKLGNAAASKRRVIPYLSIVSISTDDAASTVTIHALVPSKRDDPTSTTKLWKLSGTPTLVDHPPPRRSSSSSSSSSSAQARVRDWVELGQSRAYETADKRTRTFHVVVNPIGGKGLAKRAWETSVKPVLDAARVPYEMTYTGPRGSSNHAFAIGQSHDATRFDALIAVSGDGIVHELLNGLSNHHSGKGRRALSDSPIVHVPCGSGNALATSVVGSDRVGDWKWCTLVGLKGNPLPIDLCSVTQRGGKRLYSFLTQAFGLMADLDLGTEHLRFLGDFRFTLGYIQGALSRKTYPIKLTVLVESSSKQVIAQNYNARLAAAAADNGGGAAPTTATVEDQDEMPRLRYGTPDEPLPTEVERDMAERRTLDHLPKDGEMDGEGKWWTIDLTSPPRPTPPSSSSSSRRRGDDKKGVFFLYGGKLPWISKDLMMFPPSSPCSGLLDLCIVAPMSPLEALTAMDSPGSGALYHHPSVLYLQTRAYRLSFPHADAAKEEKELGYVSIDGEKVDHEDFNVEVHERLARVMVLEGRLMGSRRVEGV